MDLVGNGTTTPHLNENYKPTLLLYYSNHLNAFQIPLSAEFNEFETRYLNSLSDQFVFWGYYYSYKLRITIKHFLFQSNYITKVLSLLSDGGFVPRNYWSFSRRYWIVLVLQKNSFGLHNHLFC